MVLYSRKEEMSESPKPQPAEPEIKSTMRYYGHDLALCLEADGSAAVRVLPHMWVVCRGDVLGQCWHVGKWEFRRFLTRSK